MNTSKPREKKYDDLIPSPFGGLDPECTVYVPWYSNWLVENIMAAMKRHYHWLEGLAVDRTWADLFESFDSIFPGAEPDPEKHPMLSLSEGIEEWDEYLKCHIVTLREIGNFKHSNVFARARYHLWCCFGSGPTT